MTRVGSYSSSRSLGSEPGSDTKDLVLLEVQLVTKKQGRPQSNELLPFKGRAGVSGSRNADPQAPPL